MGPRKHQLHCRAPITFKSGFVPFGLAMSFMKNQTIRICTVLIGLLVTSWGGWPTSLDAWQPDYFTVTLASGQQFQGRLAPEHVLGKPTDNMTCWMIDDDLRKIFMRKPRQGFPTAVPATVNEVNLDVWQKAMSTTSKEGWGFVQYSGPFDSKGHRLIVIRNLEGRLEQHVLGITKVTPRYTVLEPLVGIANAPNWTMKVATNSIPTDILHQVLMLQIAQPERPEEYFKIFDLFLQMQQYPAAIEQLNIIAQKFPDLKEQIAEDRGRALRDNSRQVLEEVDLRLQSGQIKLALSLAQVINKEGLAEEIKIDFAQREVEIENQLKQVAELRQLVMAFLERYIANHPDDVELQQRLKLFASELEQQLSPITAPRLATFRLLAADETQTEEQRLALAISGWVLGSASAIDNFAVSQDLLPVRDLVREYLGESTPGRRAAILTELEQYEGSTPQFLAAMIQQIGPAQPADITQYTGEAPLRFPLSIPGTPLTNQQPIQGEYFVHLPPEYDPRREYPCLVALPTLGTAEQQLAIWCGDYNPRLGVRMGQAMRHGYITVSVDWKMPGQRFYGYSDREHRIVLAAMRDTLRRFNIDSDRVFLTGHGEGAAAAYDIGISHPEHFAGVIPISGAVEQIPIIYLENEHLGLSFFAVVGSRDPVINKRGPALWFTWLSNKSRPFNDIIVMEYHGRAGEVFFEAQPDIFTWMATQRRRLPQLGEDLEVNCRAMRPGDNYYWFFEIWDFPEEQIMWPHDYIDRDKAKVLGLQTPPRGIEFSMKRRAGTNVFDLSPNNHKGRAILWLSNESVNFDERVEIRLMGKFRDFVKPSRRILLDDVRARADRKHPFWAKLVANNKIWSIEE